MKLQNHSNETLLQELKSLVGREKKIVAQVIEYLKEIDLRKLYSRARVLEPLCICGGISWVLA